MKISIIILFVFLLFSPLVTAGVMGSSFPKNYISNIDQFPDYEFILSVQYEGRQSTRLEIVNQDTGLIPVWSIGGYPLFGSVYALKKSDSKYNWEKDKWTSVPQIFNLEDIGAKKVITNLELFRDVKIGIANITNYYDVDLDLTKNKPDKFDIQVDIPRALPISYFYFIIPVIALTLILIIFIIRKNRK